MKIDKYLVILFFIILIYPFLIKYNYVAHNQYEQIPLILRSLNPHFLINDWSINVNSQFSPRDFYTHYMSFWARFMSLPLTYYLHFILSIGMVALATFKVTHTLYKSRFISLITSVCILFGTSFTLGGNDLVGRDQDPARLAFAMVLIGFAFLFENIWIVSPLFFAFASYIHPLIGFEIPFVFYGSGIMAQFIAKSKTRTIFKSFILYILLSSYSLYTYIQATLHHGTGHISVERLFTILVYVRAPSHYLPSSWNASTYILFLLFLLGGLVMFRHFYRRYQPLYKQTIIISIIIILFFSFIGYIFTEIISNYYVTVLQLFRMTVVLYWLCAILIIAGILYISIGKKQNNFLLFLPATLFIIAQPGILFSPGPTHTLVIFIAFLSCILLYKVKPMLMQNLFILIMVFNFSLLYRHYSFEFYQTYPFPTEETDIERWIKFNTDKNAIFLIPPDFYSFRLNAERAAVVDWLVMPFDPNDMVEWMSRIKEISGLTGSYDKDISEARVISGYHGIDVERVSFLQKKYKFQYLILVSTTPMPYKLIYRSRNYVVYQI